jgi:hypothetical protein
VISVTFADWIDLADCCDFKNTKDFERSENFGRSLRAEVPAQSSVSERIGQLIKQLELSGQRRGELGAAGACSVPECASVQRAGVPFTHRT